MARLHFRFRGNVIFLVSGLVMPMAGEALQSVLTRRRCVTSVEPITTWKDLAGCYRLIRFSVSSSYSTSSEMEAIALQLAERIRTTANDQHLPGARRYNYLGKSIGQVIRHLNPIFKNKAFEQEREWRIIFFEGDAYPDRTTSKFRVQLQGH